MVQSSTFCSSVRSIGLVSLVPRPLIRKNGLGTRLRVGGMVEPVDQNICMHTAELLQLLANY